MQNPRLLLVFIFFPFVLHSQAKIDSFDVKEITQNLKILASDSFKGRGNGSPDLLKAGLFVGSKFSELGLKPVTGAASFYLPFRPFGGSKFARPDKLIYNGDSLEPEKYVFINSSPGNYPAKTLADFTIVKLDKPFTQDILKRYQDSPSDLLIWTSQKQPGNGNYLPPELKMPANGLKKNILLVYAKRQPKSISLSGFTNYYSGVEYNVVAMLPGKSKPEEIIMFSAHYDHEGVYPGEKDSIMNGANDDASGVAAILALARYYNLAKNNERTLVFCAFAGEELELSGSKTFASSQLVKQVIAMINIEMIGIPQYGKNKIFITGENRSALPAILKKGFAATAIKPVKEIYPQLFERSDNYPFYSLGVPAHTIMSSDDNEPCYHQPCDEIKRIDIANMVNIIRAISFAARNLVSGKQIVGP
jgi:hypothetical protein